MDSTIDHESAPVDDQNTEAVGTSDDSEINKGLFQESFKNEDIAEGVSEKNDSLFQEDIARATAAAVLAAETAERSDSILVDTEEAFHHRLLSSIRSDPEILAALTEEDLIEYESVEATTAQNVRQTILYSHGKSISDSETRRAKDEELLDDSMTGWEHGAFSSPTNNNSNGTPSQHSSNEVDRANVNKPIDELPDSIEDILVNCGSLSLPVARLEELWKRSEEEVAHALWRACEGKEYNESTKFSYTIRPSSNLPEPSILMLYSLFATFCYSPPSLDSVADIYRSEVEMFEGVRKSPTPVMLPTDGVICMGKTQKEAVVNILVNHWHLLKLPAPFQLTFFRILIRLLTNESDEEYNVNSHKTLIFLEDDTKDLHDENPTTVCMPSADPTSQSKARNTVKPRNPSKNVAELQKRTHERVKKMREERESIDKRRKKQSWIVERMRQSTETFSASKKSNQLYAIIRFRSGDAWGDRTAVSVLLDLMELVRQQNHHLLFPVARLLGLTCSAGVDAGELRRILKIAEEPVVSSDILDRLLTIHALTAAAEGVSPFAKPHPKYFYTFGRSPSGLDRTFHSLPGWPFRNDFGAAFWFRAESLAGKDGSTLLSVMTSDGAGVEISLIPLKEDETATVVCVAVRDAGHKHAERAMVRNCVLLPRVWYHLAVRHTRSRLKGVFSLSARQQISIFLDGKLILTEPLKFPNTSYSGQDESTSAISFLSGLQSNKQNSTTLVIQFGSNFEGQAGALYLFNDNVSDATLRALFRATARKRSGMVRKSSIDDSQWDSENKVEKTVAEMNTVDADEVVMTKEPSKSSVRSITSTVVVDLLEETEENDGGITPELTKAALGSKLFLVWDPKRREDSVILDLHSGGHVSMNPDIVNAWHVDDPKDVIANIGGVQALLPTFSALLAGRLEHWWKNDDSNNPESTLRIYAATAIPALLTMLAAFVRSHDGNAREAMRCGCVDIIEQLLLKNDSLSSSGDCLVGVVRSSTALGSHLLDKLIELRLACEHYGPLETSVFSRLFFNLPLWFGGSQIAPGVALYSTLLPALSSITLASPQKVRDTVGVRQLIEMVHLYTDIGDTKDEISRVSREPATGLFDRSPTSGLDMQASLTIQERRHVVDVLLGMTALMLSCGTPKKHLLSFLTYISFNADYDWEHGSLQSRRGDDPNIRVGTREERHVALVKAVTILSVLLKSRPPLSDLHNSLNLCCGGSLGTVSWILCTLVNTFDDDVRSLGIRCLAEFLEMVESTGDTTLSGENNDEALVDRKGLHVGIAARKLTLTFTNVGKTITTAMAGTHSLPVTKVVGIDIVYKLLWHLLKCHRIRMGKRTHSSLIYLIVEDRGGIESVDAAIERFVVPDEILHSGYRLNAKYDPCLVFDVESVGGKRLRPTSAVCVVFRLLRFLPNNWKEKCLVDLVTLANTCPANVPILIEDNDWQPSLFHVVSDAVEEMDSRKGTKTLKQAETQLSRQPFDLADISSAGEIKEVRSEEVFSAENSIVRGLEDIARIQARFDLSLRLYSILLGHCFRQGGDRDVFAVEQAVSLERVCVNGYIVCELILNHLLFDLTEYGTMNLTTMPNRDSMNEHWLLKESARRVTDAILSKGNNPNDAAFALKQWHSLRHLAVTCSCVVSKSGLGVDRLFNYRLAASVDVLSGGLYGIRLPEDDVAQITAADYSKTAPNDDTDGAKPIGDEELHNRVCVRIAAQTLSLLDAFIFPDSLDASLPISQLHGLALVRSSETRLGSSQGPVLASMIRLSLVLLCILEPSSVKFLQCCSRLRCFLHWTLELIRESVALAGYSAAFHDLTAPLDRLVLAIVIHCHRALARCASVLFEIESMSSTEYFQDEDMKKKNDRRLLRVTFELREIVVTAYRGRNEVLRTALSASAFEALKNSLERRTSAEEQIGQRKPTSKEGIVREFLSSQWVTGFQDVDIRGDLVIPDQVVDGTANHNRTSSYRGSQAIEELAAESSKIISEFDRALDKAFKIYLEDQKNWADTDLVRDLEYDGDMAVKRLSLQHKAIQLESLRVAADRACGAASRWEATERQVVELWTSAEARWQFPKHPDCLGRRILLTRNRKFDNHDGASYELMLGLERERAEKESAERLKKMEEEKEREKLLADVIKRNSAYVPYDTQKNTEEDDDLDDSADPVVQEKKLEAEDLIGEISEGDTIASTMQPSEIYDSEVDHHDIDVGKDDPDAWAKTFVWNDTEAVVARFDDVTVVRLRTITEGKLLLTTHGVYFHHTGNTINVMTKEIVTGSEIDNLLELKCLRWRLSRLKEAHGRRFMLRAQAIELFFTDGVEIFLNFNGGTRDRDRFYAKLRNSCKVPLLWSPKSLNPRIVFKKSKITQLWRKGRISNFEYLMQLNKMAGRTFNDVTQYPVFPWVIRDYTSETIDLSDSRVYRDLSKPVGALNEDRLATLIARYNDLASFGFADNERFLYGSHYSSPGVVLHYLIRQEPFTSMAIELQSGRFDCPDRLFFDIAGCWNSCNTSTSDVKELVPELFTCPEVLLNTNKFPLGRTQDNREISDVALPPWAKGCAHEFVRIHRLALESEYVSRNLHNWVDLIFGFKQRGPEAEGAHNIFHYLSYEGAIDMDKIVDEVERKAAESHIQNFGQTPSQLLAREPHPARCAQEERWKPLIHNADALYRLRCHTPSKQFSPRQAKGAALSILVLSDSIIVVYADMNVGTYKFSPPSRNVQLPFSFRMDKLRPLARRDLSMSRTAIKRGSAAPASMDLSDSHHAVGNWSFAVTVGGATKEGIRRKAQTLRLTTSLGTSSDGTRDAEANACILSCGYWDHTVKVHSLDGLKLLGSDVGGHQGPIRCLTLGADGALMVTGGQDATCRVWVVDHPDMALALSDGYVQTSLGASYDGESLLTLCHVLWGHLRPISCLGLSADLDVVVSGDLGGQVCVHTIRRGEFIRSITVKANVPGTAAKKIALDSHGSFVVYMEDQGLHVYTINNFHLCSAHADDVLHDMKITSHGEMLVTGGDKGIVVIRTVRDLRVRSTLDISKHGPIRCISLTPDDLNPIPQYLFIGSHDGMITIVSDDPEARVEHEMGVF